MSLYQQVRDSRVDAMKRKNKVARTILSTLLGEVETKSKRDGSDVSDEMIVQSCKKIIAANNETIGVLTSVEQQDQLKIENTILDQFLPKQLTEDQIRTIVKNLAAKNMGEVMRHMKANYAGQYDGRMTSTIAKELV